ncbi:jg15100 [Pararge aegeria aegeria]|uniref:Jg15100 protein n=1 Tax=Pararge aegeria aegeria TaxID=348720 RepID=A0A8S4RF35_9NEOP|nr:jg15100 [Pararge aegeria aegeria]
MYAAFPCIHIRRAYIVTAPKFPVVIKIGHAHSGVAKVKVDSLADFQSVCRPGLTKTTSRSSVAGSGAASPEERSIASGPPSVPPPVPLATAASIDRPLPPIPAEPSQPPPPPLARRDSQAASQSSTVSSASVAPSTASSSATPAVPSAASTARSGFARQGSLSATLTEDAEDTMKNLRKTFAGIFGDM